MRGIDMRNLRTVDLNLLVAFEALMRERNVTRAADRIGLAQPSMSNALARLRTLFKDELFIAMPKQMRPTQRALDLAGPIADALRHIRLAVDPNRPFDPATAARCFRVAGTNHANVTLIVPVVEMLRREAPATNLFIRTLTPPQTVVALCNGDIDLAVGVMHELPRALACRPLLSDRAVCLARRDHPALKGGLTLKTFVALPHIRAALTEDPVEEVDVALAHRGLERRFAMIVPSDLAVCVVVANSAMLGVVPERLARPVATRIGVAIHEIPLELGPWTLTLFWCRQAEQDPATCWLRDRVGATFAASADEAGVAELVRSVATLRPRAARPGPAGRRA
jgi:DNA-binding transcriptional LysR family regulator